MPLWSWQLGGHHGYTAVWPDCRGGHGAWVAAGRPPWPMATTAVRGEGGGWTVNPLAMQILQKHIQTQQFSIKPKQSTLPPMHSTSIALHMDMSGRAQRAEVASSSASGRPASSPASSSSGMHVASSSASAHPAPASEIPQADPPHAKKRKANDRWTYYDIVRDGVSYGQLAIDITRTKMNAHCNNPDHLGKGIFCHMDRGCVQGNRKDSGRPAGSLLAWSGGFLWRHI